MTHEVSSDRVHTPKTRLSSFIKIAVFQRNLWNMGANGTSGCVQYFHSANQIDACVYSVLRKHEDKGVVYIKVHRFTAWWNKTAGLSLYLAPLARSLLPLLRVLCLHMSVDVARP